jgi:uncharacterized protein YyaL (SSP411 family)
VVAAADPQDDQATQSIALLADRPMVEGKPTAYVCRNFVCLAPATTVEELAERLKQ